MRVLKTRRIFVKGDAYGALCKNRFPQRGPGDKHNMQMRRVILMALIAGTQMAGFAAGADQSNFAGKWKADLAKCKFGMESVPGSLVYTVEQKGLTLNIERVKQENGNETKTAHKVDGKLDGTTLILEYSANTQGYDLDIIETWSLSADGNNLTVLRSISAAGGGTEQKLVFHREI
jgi:hypothetical protein